MAMNQQSPPASTVSSVGSFVTTGRDGVGVGVATGVAVGAVDGVGAGVGVEVGAASGTEGWAGVVAVSDGVTTDPSTTMAGFRLESELVWPPVVPGVVESPVVSVVPPCPAAVPEPEVSVLDVPDVPVEPEVSVPDVPVVPVEPEVSVPDVPDVPVEPEVSVPDVPDVPVEPEVSVPDVPVVPVEPEVSVPDVPDVPPVDAPDSPPGWFTVGPSGVIALTSVPSAQDTVPGSAHSSAVRSRTETVFFQFFFMFKFSSLIHTARTLVYILYHPGP